MSTQHDQDIIMMQDQEEEKKQPINQKREAALPGFMLSQESIKQIEEAADHEAKEERQKLLAFEKQKRDFAHQLRHQQDQEFLRKQDQTKQERLRFLLKQSEIFSHFILQNNKKGAGELEDDHVQKNGNISTMSKQLEKGGQGNGKSSVSKRHSKRVSKINDDDGDQNSDEVITRLFTQPSILKGGTLRDYQLDGLNWLIALYERGINGILADEMVIYLLYQLYIYQGLGKTIQTISLLAFLREYKHIKGYHLIIVPKSTIPNWVKEFKKWCPQQRVVNLIARKEFREDILKNDLQPDKFDICITTFEGCRICMPQLGKFKWEYLIVDEAHKIKNEDSIVSQKLRQLKTRYRLLLTGTPLQNNLHELWSLLNFLLPDVFSSAEDFDEWFDLGGNKNGEKLTDQEKEHKNKEIVGQLHKILRPFMLRRIKKEVEKNLPPKVEVHITVGITEQQKSIYRQLLKKSAIEKGTSQSFYKNIIIQLRKVCDHPYLFDNQEPEGAEEFGEHIITSCGKMIFLDKLLKKMREENNQVLIFSGFTSMLDILEDYCLYRQYKYCRLDGNTELDDREKYIEDFTSPDSEKFIFLISTRAGGLGLNLMTANIVVLYDSDWNPQIDLQAMDRAHRIGQKKIVQVFRLITKKTMEEKLIEKQTMKLKLDSLIIQKGRLAPKHQGLQKDELQDMVNYGADAIFELGNDLQDEDINQLIKNGEDKANEIQRRAEEIVKDKFNMIDFEMNSVNMYQFEDVDYLQEKRKEQEQALKKHVVNMLNDEVKTGRREKKAAALNLNESKLFPKFFQGGNIGISSETKKKKLLKVQDFRFFPNPERLKFLLEKEMNAKFTSMVTGVEQVIFSEEEKREKEYLWGQGFVDWDRRDYQRYCQALEFCAKNDYDSISKHIQTKSPEEVEKYSKVFFEKYETLQDYEKIQKNIEKAEKNLSFREKAPEYIRNKIMAYESPIDEMTIYATQKSKYFSKESDIILLCLTNQLGYGNWKTIKSAIRRDPRCRFDHLFLSRNENEISRRVDILVKALEKEEQQQTKKTSDALTKNGLNGQVNQEGDLFITNEDGTTTQINTSTKQLQQNDDNESFISEESKYKQPKAIKQNHKSKSNHHKVIDVTESDHSSSEDDKKFSHLKAESELRIGQSSHNQNHFENEVEEVNPNQKSGSNNILKKQFDSNNKTGNGYKNKIHQNDKQNGGDKQSLKQTKLPFQKLVGSKRHQPEKLDDDEGSLLNEIEIDEDSAISENSVQQKKAKIQ